MISLILPKSNMYTFQKNMYTFTKIVKESFTDDLCPELNEIAVEIGINTLKPVTSDLKS